MPWKLLFPQYFLSSNLPQQIHHVSSILALGVFHTCSKNRQPPPLFFFFHCQDTGRWGREGTGVTRWESNSQPLQEDWASNMGHAAAQLPPLLLGHRKAGQAEPINTTAFSALISVWSHQPLITCWFLSSVGFRLNIHQKSSFQPVFVSITTRQCPVNPKNMDFCEKKRNERKKYAGAVGTSLLFLRNYFFQNKICLSVFVDT